MSWIPHPPFLSRTPFSSTTTDFYQQIHETCAPLWVQFLSFSCSFQEKFDQIIGWHPHLGVGIPSVWEILGPRLVLMTFSNTAQCKKLVLCACAVFTTYTVCALKRLGCHAEISRCCIRSESEETIAHVDFEIQDRRHQKSITGVSVTPQYVLQFFRLKSWLHPTLQRTLKYYVPFNKSCNPALSMAAFNCVNVASFSIHS